MRRRSSETGIAIHSDDVVRLAHTLIAIESHSQVPGREAAIGHALTDWFGARGVEAALVPAIGERSNLVARVTVGSGRGPSVLLNGHIDTVPAGAMANAFSPRVVDGVLHGRGACDMKGAVAAMACVLAAFQSAGDAAAPPSSGDALDGTVLFAGTVDEETGSLGVKRLVDSGSRADYAIVGEPTSLRPTIAHKGACFIRIVLSGRGAHGSCPEKGVSATSYGARIVTQIEDELRARLACRTHPLLGASTVSVGRICGGTEPNIVAERCEIDVDRRTLPGEIDTVGEVADLVRSVCGGVDGLSADVYETERTSAVPHVPLGTSPDSPLSLAAVAECRAAGLPAEPVGVTYWTDGAHLAASGIETIILGPGDIADAHGPRERVRVDDLARAAALYAGIVARLLRTR